MGILIKVFSISIVGVLIIGLLGCGGFLPPTLFTPDSLNPYSDVYEAARLQYTGKYKAAIAKYEQTLKNRSHFPAETKVRNVSFPVFLKYGIAFCYTKLAEAENDASLYTKAESAARESYQSAVLGADRADALYLWGYILLKQGRYEEACAKFEEQVEISTESRENESRNYILRSHFLEDALFGLGKAYMGLGDAPAAQRTFGELREHIASIIEEGNGGFYTTQVLYGLGKMSLELGDEPAALSAFEQVLAFIETDLQSGFVAFDADIFYEDALFGVGKVYLELGDEPAAQQAFALLLEHYPESPHKAEVERLFSK